MKYQFLVVSTVVLSAALISCAAPKPSSLAPSIEPQANTLFTSTREVRDLKVVGETLWAATSGGVLRFENGKWTKWTIANGLPSNEALQCEKMGKTVRVRFPRNFADFDGKTWKMTPAPAFQRVQPKMQWDRNLVTATLDGIQIGTKNIKLPAQSTGSHVSAFFDAGYEPDKIAMFIYGDGMWIWSGKWVRAENQPPKNAWETTAFDAKDEATQWAGTRRDGIFQRHLGKWKQFLQTDEPFSHNIQFLNEYRGTLFATTLDDGLIYRSGANWGHVTSPLISSSAPRQMFVWRDQLYVRHGGGVVDSFDGTTWTKSALKSIPRSGIYALGGDENHLIASGWGGFAEWDGTTWTPHYDLPLLKGIPVMGIVPDGDDLWLLTQSRGLMKWSRAGNDLTVYDERNGLSDDWSTAFARSGDELFAGTFIGGLCHFDGEKWVQFPETKGENITAIAAIEGGVIATSRSGAWRVKNGIIEKVAEKWIEPELQAVMRTKDGVWLGGRTSINFWKL